jgi:magnesium transporter
VIEALEQTNESVISHRQNYRLQLLTVFSVLFLPLTLISGIFGMNFGFDSTGFITIVAIMGTLFLAAVAFFRWKSWL